MGTQADVRDIRVHQNVIGLIKSGRKTLEVRTAYKSMRRITPGRILRFNEDDTCLRRVTRVTRYPSIEAMLQAEDCRKIHPDKSRKKVSWMLNRICTSDREYYGILVFALEPA